MKNMVHLPLKNAFNVRELGGYPTKDGQVTMYCSFLRGDDLSALDQQDIDFLLNYGLTSVVDLRSAVELDSHPDALAAVSPINYINIPLVGSDAVNPDLTKARTILPEQFIMDFYLEILKSATDAIKQVFEFMAAQEGCVLFHCAAGKDRTGIIAMLLLGLAGVSKPDIIANYIVTEVYIKENPILQQYQEDLPLELMQSKPEYIETMLDYILSTFGSFEGYLMHINLTQETLLLVKNKLVTESFQLQS